MNGRNEQRANRRRFLKATVTASAAAITAAVTVNAAFPSLVAEKIVFEANHSHWATALPPTNPSLEQDIEADIAVIGGGFTGLSAAYYLKQNSPTDRVVLLEAARCGNGASGRNGAMLLTTTEDRYMEASGNPDLDKRIYDLSVDNSKRLVALSKQQNLDAEIELNGALQVCNTDELAELGRQYIEKARNAGFPLEFWPPARIAETIGTRAYRGALFDPHSGQVHPGKLVALWKSAAASAGVQIYESTPVIDVDEGERIGLGTGGGKTVRARSIILATNAYSSKLGYLRGAVAPLFDYVGMTAPLPDSLLAEIGWKNRIPFNDSRTEVYYLGLTKDNRIHIGGGPVDYVFNDGLAEPPEARKRFEGLRVELGRIFPALQAEPFEKTWSGIVDMSLDQTSSVGRLGKHGNIFYAIGFSGHGVNLTSLFGRVLADLVSGKAAGWSWLPYLDRLPPYTPNEPARWLGVQAALTYYRRMDPKQP